MPGSRAWLLGTGPTSCAARRSTARSNRRPYRPRLTRETAHPTRVTERGVSPRPVEARAHGADPRGDPRRNRPGPYVRSSDVRIVTAPPPAHASARARLARRPVRTGRHSPATCGPGHEGAHALGAGVRAPTVARAHARPPGEEKRRRAATGWNRHSSNSVGAETTGADRSDSSTPQPTPHDDRLVRGAPTGSHSSPVWVSPIPVLSRTERRRRTVRRRRPAAFTASATDRSRPVPRHLHRRHPTQEIQ